MLYLVPTPVGNLGDMTYRGVDVLRSASLVLAEDTRTSRVLMQRYSIDTPMQSYTSSPNTAPWPRWLSG